MTFEYLRFKRAWLTYSHDLIMTACALVLTVYLRVGGAAWSTYYDAVAVGVPVLVAIGDLDFAGPGDRLAAALPLSLIHI